MAKRNRFDVDESLETPFNIKHLKKLSVYIKKHIVKMVLALLFSVISVLSGLLYPLILKRTFDVTIPNKDFKELFILSFIFLLSVGLSILMICIRSRIMAVVSQNIIHDVRRDLFIHLQELPFQFYDDRPQGKILTRVISYVDNLSNILSNSFINFILDLLNILFIGIFMFLIDVKLSLIIILGIPLFAIFMGFMYPKIQRKWRNFSNKTSNLNAYTQESVDGIKITQLFVREKYNNDVYENLSQIQAKSWIKAQYALNFLWTSGENVSCWVKAAVYLLGILMFTNVSFGTIVAISDYAIRFWAPITNLANIYTQFVNAIAYLERIFELMGEPVIVSDASDAKDFHIEKGKVVFNDVTFGYDEDINILENISFDVEPGESIAFVGPTGAGKTTIVNLISRFYNVNTGAVLIDNQDIADVKIKSLRSQMGVMLQESFIFSGTIMDNIKYSNPDASDKLVEDICKSIGIHDMIKKLGGYETMVSERGGSLSQGQKQLIAFARTMLADPKIIILDEATSAIDAKTEKLVQNAIDEMLKGRTSFVIAHRLSTIKNCDKIMVVSNKGIVESGNHNELMAKKGHYYHLYTSQMA